jgi:hypothetical protein
MPGLGPGIHDEMQRTKTYEKVALPNAIMDCRDKPGNDRQLTVRRELSPHKKTGRAKARGVAFRTAGDTTTPR